jgi:hypothetical protein
MRKYNDVRNSVKSTKISTQIWSLSHLIMADGTGNPSIRGTNIITSSII